MLPWQIHKLNSGIMNKYPEQIFVTGRLYPRWQSSWGQHVARLGPVGPRWAPYWPHEPCYLGPATCYKVLYEMQFNCPTQVITMYPRGGNYIYCNMYIIEHDTHLNPTPTASSFLHDIPGIMHMIHAFLLFHGSWWLARNMFPVKYLYLCYVIHLKYQLSVRLYE